MTDAVDSPATEPAPATGAAPGRRGRNMLGWPVLAGAVLIAIFFVGLYVVTGRKEDQAQARIQSLSAPQGLANDPRNAPSSEYIEMVREANDRRVDAASQAQSAAVVPPLLGGGESLPEPAVPPPIRMEYSERAPAERRDVRSLAARKVAAMQALTESWTPATQGVFAGGGYVPVATESMVGADAQGPPPPKLPLLTVMTAVVEVGANSDYPGAVIARLTGGPLAGAKFLGSVSSGGAGRGGDDRVTMRFDKLLYQDVYYDVRAIAVDAGARIPAIKGDTNYHVVHNVIHEAGAAFLLGYAAAARSSSGYIGGITIGPEGTYSQPGFDTANLIRGQAAQTAAGALQQGSYRGPTVTLPAGSAVGVVLLEPPRSSARLTASTAAPATAMTPLAARQVATPRPAPPIVPTEIRAPDGTRIRMEGEP